ncbi:MAG TPA: choice-of-anchor D domain-containing protein, partial [Acidobacteriaceae bacterium]|nr:choice-of-anchor D domain-containing protein [Acidobacteriaceae bacterium]
WRDICNQNSGNCAGPVSFGARIDTTALETSATNATIIGGDYALALATVHTATDTLLFAGTQDLYRCSLNSGCTWRNTTNALGCAAAGVATAQHAIVGVGNTMFFASDGGVWRTTDAVTQTGTACSNDDAAHFQNLNAGLGSLAEIASFAQHPTDAGVLLTSAGRNGIAGAASLATTEWTQVSTSAFNPVAIDQQTPANWYAETDAGVSISRCTGGANCLQTKFADPPVIASAQVSGDLAALNAPFVLDPVDQTRVLVGTCRLWRGSADGTGWSAANAISTMFDGHQQPSCNGNSVVRSIAAAGPQTPSGSQVIYVGMAAGGSAGGHVLANYAADQATGSTVWTDIALSPVANDVANGGRFNAAGFDISSVTADPHDVTGKTVYATVAGFSGNGISAPLVYRSTDGGANWQNITSNLPVAPANALLVDARDANTLYIALDSGVYVTNTVTNCALLTANCWSSYLTGLPTAPVTSLSQIAIAGQSVLRAGTAGRGIWQTAPTTLANPGHITLSPTSLTFAQQGVATTSAAQNVTVTNSGGSPVTVIALTVSPNFTASTACPTPLAPQATCTIQVSFAPTVAGTLGGTLSVTDGMQPQIVTLSGVAALNASMTVGPANLGFPTTAVGSVSATQVVSVTNTSGAPLTEFSVSTSAADFRIVAGGTCTATIAAKTTCSIKIAFAPAAAGSRIASLGVAAKGAQPQSVALTGTGADFTVSVVGSPTATVTAGKTAQYMIAVTPAAGSVGFANLVCSNLPLHTTGLTDPAVASLAAASTINVSVGTSAKAAAHPLPGVWFGLAAPFLFPWNLLARRGRRRVSSFFAIVLAAATLGLVAGCGAGTATLIGAPAGTGATAPGSYNFVVSATSGGLTRSVNLTLVVQ